MKTNTESRESLQRPKKKNKYSFSVDAQRIVEISSDFDNGNIALRKQVTQLQYRLYSVPDTESGSSKKSWFHFKIRAPHNTVLRMTIEDVSQSNSGASLFIEKRKPQSGKRQLTASFRYQVASYKYRDDVQLVIDFCFDGNPESWRYFALTIPFTYGDNEEYLEKLKYLVPSTVNYSDEILGRTPNLNHNIHLLTIEDKNLTKNRQQSSSPHLFVVITCRVHPGEVSSSYCLMGILQFLLKPFSLEATLLRKMFTFLIVPMINPEGVFEGNYRMDLGGQNLNRVYSAPDPFKHKGIFQLKKRLLQNHVKKGDRIAFHFDLHSHSTMKRAFIYGNAFDNIVSQTETELFCKIVDRNCRYFSGQNCLFDERHMKFKDKGENISKQGCARVVLSRLASITYSYTVETSIFSVEAKSGVGDLQRKQNNLKNQDFSIYDYCRYDFLASCTDTYGQIPSLNDCLGFIDQNRNVGFSLMICILDLFRKNPYTEVSLAEIQEWRRRIAWKNLQSQVRFKMLDTKAYSKAKNIESHCQTKFYKSFMDSWKWLAKENLWLNSKWPECFFPFSHTVGHKNTQSAIKVRSFSNSNFKKMNWQKAKTQTDQNSQKDFNISHFAHQKTQADLTSQQIMKNTICSMSSFTKYSFEKLPVIEQPTKVNAQKCKRQRAEKLQQSSSKKSRADVLVMEKSVNEIKQKQLLSNHFQHSSKLEQSSYSKQNKQKSLLSVCTLERELVSLKNDNRSKLLPSKAIPIRKMSEKKLGLLKTLKPDNQRADDCAPQVKDSDDNEFTTQIEDYTTNEKSAIQEIERRIILSRKADKRQKEDSRIQNSGSVLDYNIPKEQDVQSQPLLFDANFLKVCKGKKIDDLTLDKIRFKKQCLKIHPKQQKMRSSSQMQFHSAQIISSKVICLGQEMEQKK